MQNEDVEYLSSDIPTPDGDVTEERTENTSALKATLRYIDTTIQVHNSFDAIDLSKNYPFTPSQQIAIHKEVVRHLRNIKEEISNRLKEK